VSLCCEPPRDGNDSSTSRTVRPIGLCVLRLLILTLSGGKAQRGKRKDGGQLPLTILAYLRFPWQRVDRSQCLRYEFPQDLWSGRPDNTQSAQAHSYLPRASAFEFQHRAGGLSWPEMHIRSVFVLTRLAAGRHSVCPCPAGSCDRHSAACP
jgi:hypothetical protein